LKKHKERSIVMRLELNRSVRADAAVKKVLQRFETADKRR